MLSSLVRGVRTAASLPWRVVIGGSCRKRVQLPQPGSACVGDGAPTSTTTHITWPAVCLPARPSPSSFPVLALPLVTASWTSGTPGSALFHSRE